MTPNITYLVINAARAGSPGHLAVESVGNGRNWRTACGRTVRGVPQLGEPVTCPRCIEAR